MNFYLTAVTAASAVQMTAEQKTEISLSTTLIGLTIVFAVLIILTLLISLFGYVGEKLNKGGSDKKPQPQPAPVKKKAPAKFIAPVRPAEDAQEDDGELMAVIAAAVYALGQECGKTLRVASVRRVDSGRPAWAVAGIRDNTRPF